MRTFSAKTLKELERAFRTALINEVSGVRTVFLGITHSGDQFNAAPLSNITHVGANPPQLSILFRPDNGSRHTLSNYRSTGKITLVAMPEKSAQLIHQCSADYGPDTFELEAIETPTIQLQGHHNPVPKEFLWAIDLQWIEQFELNNQCIYTVGEIQQITYSNKVEIKDDGHLQFADELAVVLGLKQYSGVKNFIKRPYPKI
jgi:flavin reductase (DIM6/NTAB) family NADH-FMN oxidoreductase RutF